MLLSARSLPAPLLAGALVWSACRTSTTPPRRDEPTFPEAGAALLEQVPESAVCVEAGRIAPLGTGLHVDVGGMRATVGGDRSRIASVAFTYRGPSATTEPLASGEIRRQIGLKLRAQDTCNVVYVMWHVEPSPGIFVSVKRNPDQSTHAQCGDHGYLNLKPKTSAAAPLLVVDQPHELTAEIHGAQLQVKADGLPVWEGELPADAFAFDGPAGVRSDNGAFDFALRVPEGHRAGGACPPR